MCDTRWLSVESAVSRILEQWAELKLHFSLAATAEHCHKALILKGLYDDEVNLLYLIFLNPVLKEMQQLNKNFQARNPNPTQLLSDLIVGINTLKAKIIPLDISVDILKENFDHAIMPNLYLGFAFEKKLEELQLNSRDREIRLTCVNFIKELILQLRDR